MSDDVENGHDHPNAWDVMAQYIGRPLLPTEEVRHKNGRQDNRLENLELWNRSHPPGRLADKYAWAKDFLATYEPIENKLRQLG